MKIKIRNYDRVIEFSLYALFLSGIIAALIGFFNL